MGAVEEARHQISIVSMMIALPSSLQPARQRASWHLSDIREESTSPLVGVAVEVEEGAEALAGGEEVAVEAEEVAERSSFAPRKIWTLISVRCRFDARGAGSTR